MMVSDLRKTSGKVKKPVSPETGNGKSDSDTWITSMLETDVWRHHVVMSFDLVYVSFVLQRSKDFRGHMMDNEF
jgi:hypothetical protein